VPARGATEGARVAGDSASLGRMSNYGYAPDTHDTSNDKGTRELLGKGRTVPSDFDIAPDYKVREMPVGSLVAAAVIAMEVYGIANKRVTKLDEQALAGNVEAVMGSDEGPQPLHLVTALEHEHGIVYGDKFAFKARGAYRVKASAHEMLLEIKHAVHHGRPVVLGALIGMEFEKNASHAPLAREKDAGWEKLAMVVTGYDRLGNFKVLVATPGWGKEGAGWVTGEWLIAQAVDGLVLDGELVEAPPVAASVPPAPPAAPPQQHDDP
jgi:hypothetical protein